MVHGFPFALGHCRRSHHDQQRPLTPPDAKEMTRQNLKFKFRTGHMGVIAENGRTRRRPTRTGVLFHVRDGRGERKERAIIRPAGG